MRCRLAALLFASIGAFASAADAATGINAFPPDVTQALHATKSVELYSLEPWFDPETEETQWHDVVLLGHVALSLEDTKLAVAQLETAVRGWDGQNPECFDPRHAIAVKSGAHSYELVISFDCQSMEVYRDGALVDSLHLTNTPAVFDKLLKKNNLPLSQSSAD